MIQKNQKKTKEYLIFTNKRPIKKLMGGKKPTA